MFNNTPFPYGVQQPVAPQYAAVPPVYPQPMSSPVRAPQQPAQMTTNKQFASGVDGIKNMSLPQGTFVFFDNDRQILYDTVVDELGRKEVTPYEFKRIEPPTQEQIEAAQPVTKQDLKTLQEQMLAMQQQLKEIKQLNGGLE